MINGHNKILYSYYNIDINVNLFKDFIVMDILEIYNLSIV